MNDSLMVVATKYILEVPIPGSNGAYKKDGQKKEISTKVVPRAYVEDRNKDINNELYIIDIEATENMIAMRNENVKESVGDGKKKVTKADLFKKATKKPKKEVKVKDEIVEVDESFYNEDTPIEDLQAYCDKNDIKYHHKAGVAKLLELINE